MKSPIKYTFRKVNTPWVARPILSGSELISFALAKGLLGNDGDALANTVYRDLLYVLMPCIDSKAYSSKLHKHTKKKLNKIKNRESTSIYTYWSIPGQCWYTERDKQSGKRMTKGIYTVFCIVHFFYFLSDYSRDRLPLYTSMRSGKTTREKE